MRAGLWNPDLFQHFQAAQTEEDGNHYQIAEGPLTTQWRAYGAQLLESPVKTVIGRAIRNKVEEQNISCLLHGKSNPPVYIWGFEKNVLLTQLMRNDSSVSGEEVAATLHVSTLVCADPVSCLLLIVPISLLWPPHTLHKTLTLLRTPYYHVARAQLGATAGWKFP